MPSLNISDLRSVMVRPGQWSHYKSMKCRPLLNTPGKPCAIDVLHPPNRVVSIMLWELPDAVVLTGQPISKKGAPLLSSAAPADMMGIYAIGVDPDWQHPWHEDRRIAFDHSDVSGSGIEHLLVDSELGPKRWDIWMAGGNGALYRCWGPTVDQSSSHESSLVEVILFIKRWETRNGKVH